MKFQSTYPQLLTYANDAMSIQKGSPFLALLLRDKFDRFFNNNRIRLETGQKKLTDIMDVHVEKDENQNPKINEGKFVFKSEQDEADYKQKWEEINKLVFDIEI